MCITPSWGSYEELSSILQDIFIMMFSSEQANWQLEFQ
jgi:hypothetical protein